MKKTLVFGASLKPNRYSHMAVKRLLENNIETEAYGLKPGLIDTVQIKTNFTNLQNIHTVTLYINSSRQPDYYGALLNLKPKRIIFNPGTENPDFYKILQNKGIQFLEACTLVLLATKQY